MGVQLVDGQCRICATTRLPLMSIFSEEGIKKDLQFKIYHCLKIIVTACDIYPKTICEVCLARIEIYYNLVNDYRKGQLFLSSQVKYNCENYITMEQNETEFNKNPHDQNCRCRNCEIIRYGALPLLVEEMIDHGRSFDEPEPGPSSSNIVEDHNNNESSSSCESEVSSNLNTNVKKQKTYTCPDCNKLFKHRGDFNKHLRKHTGEQPFECPECHRKFAHTSNLARHRKVHSGIKPFQCEKCKRCFSRKDKLAAHKKCI